MKRWIKAGLCLLAGSLVILLGVRTSTGINPPLCTPISITVQPTSQTFCVGYNASLTVTASGSSVSYRWRKDGTNLVNGAKISGAMAQTLMFTPVTAGSAGPYDVVITNTCSSATSSVATVTTSLKPSILTQPASQTRCQGQNAIFSVTASGAQSYQWRKNNSNISGAKSATWTIYSVTTGDTGSSYDVVVSNSYGSVTSSPPATLTVITAGPSIITQPASQTRCQGQTANFSVTASGAALSYQWRRYGVSIPGETNATLTLYNVATTNAGSYNVVVANPCAISNSVSAMLTVNALTLYSVTGGGSYCSGGSGKEVKLNGSQSGVNYQLNRDGGYTGVHVQGTGSAISFGYQTVAGTYTVVATSAGTGCSATMAGSAIVTVITGPPVAYTANYQTNTINGVTSNWVGNCGWAGNYIVGSNTYADVLVITNHGVLNDNSGYLGYEAGSSSNRVLVTGSGSVWSNSGILYVGYSGRCNAMVISNGGMVVNSDGYMGYNAGSSSNRVLVTGSGSMWRNNQIQLYVGHLGSGNSLVINNGGRVVNGFGYIGFDAGSSNNSVLVTGSGSVWSNWLCIWHGTSGAGNSMVISNGGTVVSFHTLMGFNASSSNNSVLVTGTGSVWSNSGSVYVGYTGRNNSLLISNGGRVVNDTDYNGWIGYNSSNNSVLVTGSGSVWSNASDVSVGFHGSGNSLVITNGGTVVLHNLYVGYYPSSSNNLVTLNGGNLVVTNPDTGVGVLDVRRGTFTMNSPDTRVGVDQFLATNGVSSIVILNGGTLTTKTATIANGAVLQYALGTNSHPVVVNGNLTLGGGTLNITDAGGFTNGTYTLFTYTGTLTYNGLTIGTTPNPSFSYTIDTNTPGTVYVTVGAGPVAWWPFDEGSGTVTFDASGNGNDGVIYQPTWGSGILSNALSFDGSSYQYVQVYPTGTVNGTFTVAAWVLPLDPQGWLPVFSTRSLGYDTSFQFDLTYGNTIYGYIGNGSGWITISADAFSYTTGTWYHIAYVVTPTNYTIYANGAVVSSGSYSNDVPLLYDVDHPIAIGAEYYYGNGWYMFNGSIDDVRVYSRALAACEVAALYNVDTVGDGIPNWWRLQYFGSGSTTNGNSCAACDPDGDGLTNLQEYQAGTDPLHSPLPTFSPDGGAYLTAQSVTINCAAVGATIHYTTNRLEPTELDPVIASGGTVTMSAPTTLLRAHAFKSGMIGETKSALYQIGARVAAGWNDSYALQTNGTLWAWGYNYDGQLGDGTNVNRLFPKLVSLPAVAGGISPDTCVGVWAVAGGETHTVAVRADGTVWTWGNNDNGQLGNGTSSNYYRPLAISGVSNVVAVAAGESHTMALRADGTVWTWGNNGNGQLGIGSSGGNTNVPVQAVGLTQMIGIAAGAAHSMALRSDGTVWTWGDNSYVELGRAGDSTVPGQVNGLSNVVAIAAGGAHTVAVCADGTVWTWGANWCGQLGRSGDAWVPGQVSGLSNVVAIAAGLYHTLAMTATGQVYAWGYNSDGELGLGYESYYESTPQLVSSLSNVVAIAAGEYHTMAVRADGTIWTWGANSYGQLGQCTDQPTNSPGMVGLSVNSPPPILAIVSGDATICNGDSATIQIVLTGTGPWTLIWSDGITQNNVTDNPATNTVRPASTTTYTVTAVSDSECTAGVSSGSATITVNYAPSITSQPTNQTVCAGSASFTAAASGSPTPTVQWQVSTDGGATFSDISGATSWTLAFPVNTSYNGNKYRAVFSNTCGSATCFPATLISGPPVITRQPSSAAKCVGESVTFSVTASTSPPNGANGSAALRSTRLASLSAIASAAAAKTAKLQPSSQTARFRSDRILVKPKKGLKAAHLASQHAAIGAKVMRTHARMGGLQVIKLPPGLTVEKAIDRYQRSGLVEYAEPDYEVQADRTPNDPYYTDGTLWNMNNTGQTGDPANVVWGPLTGTNDADIDAPEAWDTCTSANPVIVAVIDTGVWYTHEDLAPNMWVNPGEISGNGIDDDGDGYVDDVYGINVFNPYRDPGDPLDDTDGHGTHVSGIIGAVGNNGIGVVGVAWNVRIMACAFIWRDRGSISGAIECINYAISKGAKILNNSWGTYHYSNALRDAIIAAQDADIIFVASAGNEGLDYPRYPACYDVDNIVAVAATDRNDLLADWSSYGATTVDLAAPGVDIYSCYNYSDSSYEPDSGTSMAAPHVSGALALLRARFPELNYADAIAELLDTVDPLPSLQGKTVTGGRLNLQKLLTHRQFGYQWYKDGISIAGATNSTYAISSVNLADNGLYHVVVTGQCGSTVSSNAILTVSAGCGGLSVTPSTGAYFTGPPGGPFVPSILTYMLTNGESTSLSWEATKSANWLSLSATSGTLSAGASASVVVSIDANVANSFPDESSYSDTIAFTNKTSAYGITSRPVSLTIRHTGDP